MAEFYIEKNPQTSGMHILHFSNCASLPALEELQYMGSIASYDGAEKEGLKHFHKVDACSKCAEKYATA